MQIVARATLALGLVLCGGCAVDTTSRLDTSGPVQTSFQDHFQVAVVANRGSNFATGSVEAAPVTSFRS